MTTSPSAPTARSGSASASGAPAQSRRNKSYDATHQVLIEAAVKLISEKGVEALSLAELARAVGMNRATIYYHFTGREALLEAVSAWSTQQLTRGFADSDSRQERMDFVSRFVLSNPDLIKLWIEQFIASGDVRERYSKWDELVASLRTSVEASANEDIDVEVYCTFLLAGAIIGPRVFRNSVRPDLSDDEIVARFRAEQQRMFKRDGIFKHIP